MISTGMLILKKNSLMKQEDFGRLLTMIKTEEEYLAIVVKPQSKWNLP